jgi:hypothetical protein
MVYRTIATCQNTKSVESGGRIMEATIPYVFDIYQLGISPTHSRKQAIFYVSEVDKILAE